MNNPTPPKRALTAYFRFREDVYTQVKADNSELAPKDIMSKIGAMWRELTQSQKDVYQLAFKKDQVVYNMKKAEYEKKYGKI